MAGRCERVRARMRAHGEDGGARGGQCNWDGTAAQEAAPPAPPEPASIFERAMRGMKQLPPQQEQALPPRPAAAPAMSSSEEAKRKEPSAPQDAAPRAAAPAMSMVDMLRAREADAAVLTEEPTESLREGFETES